MNARTGLAGLGLAVVAVLGPLATTGTAAAPPPAPENKLTDSICAYVQDILKNIEILKQMKVDALNPQTGGVCGKDTRPTSLTPQGEHTELVEIDFDGLLDGTM
ncbi:MULTISPECIES: hypothetical protein [unclassified Streptomyces]|uniref:hypothetical protein n=1 Tax=unclassified Streptomyces TaxID=2593676 RepID=UPI00136B6FCC|nr:MULTISPECIES: hypothetical protein [unclassified Streptomyces]NEA06557.1 hypothetical protein [Streptomyces sp. SID10116]MYY81341.1 hypothetical protein [Streptomyces sp. SID335]MYZ13843.1 hypothetical protein [Streptomyces sp. SID337]NDZ85204.1 hypothetical protein [Streptomyces sp. SID10115]NEB43907.1 hypothetical protein [Streptomyces sp. SID339]